VAWSPGRSASLCRALEAAELIRREREVPVISLTAHSDRLTVQGAERTEPSGYVLKPFELRELEESIRVALERHRAKRRLPAREP
jgi:DNA-binding NarL/FixJ family response regulator